MTDWSLIICGDWAPIGGPERSLIIDPVSYYGDLLPILRSGDLAIVNVEGAITDADLLPIQKDGVSIRIPTDLLTGLSVVPFHLACLANNHSFDYGLAGFLSTKKELSRKGINVVGAGETAQETLAPQFFSFGETRFALLNIAEGEEGRFTGGGAGVASLDLVKICAQIADLKRQVDLIAVIVHAGREYLPVPAPYIQAAFRSMAAAGAKLIVGHHPHVPQGRETYHGAEIMYSLGNFAFWFEPPTGRQKTGYFVKACFHGQELAQVETWPYSIHQEGLRLLQGEERDSFDRDLDRLSEFISRHGCLEIIWKAYSDRWFEKRGIDELGENVARLIGISKTLEAVLKLAVSEYSGSRIKDRLARALIWRLLHRLKKQKTRDTRSLDKAAAILRNRFDTPAHREVYLLALKRVMDHANGNAPQWAYDLVDEWQAL
ncbi:MAG TPA: CapA family protein [Anaerolineaceae bacterium]|nr:CapA family protein [Anaerolineaceae bacterium]